MKKNKDCLKILKNISYFCTVKTKSVMQRKCHIIMITVCLLLSFSSVAQDLTRLIQNTKTGTPLLRNYYPTSEWVMYNNYDNHFFTFGKMNTTGTSFNFLNVSKKIDVKDMVIHRDTLFFCGRIFDSTAMMYKGMMGYFRVNPMPTSNIKYIMVDSLACLNKMDVYRKVSTLHAAMVGTHQAGHGVLVDVYMDNYFGSSTNWEVKWATISDMNATFDDITATDSYVVASARVPDSTAAYLCFFTKPPLAYRSFLELNGNTLRKLLYYPFGNFVFLERGRLDTLYAVYQGLLPSLYVCQFNGTQNVVSRKFPGLLFSQLKIKDVQRSYEYSSINILASYSSKIEPDESFRTYNVPSGIMATGGTVYARTYPASIMVHSLGGNKNGYQDAAGLNPTGEMGIFRTKDNNTGTCAGLLSTTLNTMPLATDYLEKTLSRESSTESVRWMAVTTSSYSVYTSCQ